MGASEGGGPAANAPQEREDTSTPPPSHGWSRWAGHRQRIAAFVIGAGAVAAALGAVVDLPQRIGRLFADGQATQSLAELDAELLTTETPLSAFRASPTGPLVASQPTTGPLGSLVLVVALEPETTVSNSAHSDGTDVDGEDTDGSDTDGTDVDGEDTDGTDTDGTDVDGEDTDGTDTDGEPTDGEDADGTDTDGTEATDGTDADGEGSDGTGTTQIEAAMQRALDAWQAPALPPVPGDPGQPGPTIRMQTLPPKGAEEIIDVVAPELERFSGCDGHCLDALAAIIVAAALEDGTGRPDGIVQRFEERLGRVRGIERDGRNEPLGAVVQVDIALVGHRDRDLLLSWILHRVDGPGTDTLPEWHHAYRLRPTEDTDAATVNVWIPLPSEPGPYIAQLAVSDPDVPEHASLAATRTEPFGD
jgi:hypothetical protein